MAKLESRTDSDQILIYYYIKWAVYKIDLENFWKVNWTNVKKGKMWNPDGPLLKIIIIKKLIRHNIKRKRF